MQIAVQLSMVRLGKNFAFAALLATAVAIPACLAGATTPLQRLSPPLRACEREARDFCSADACTGHAAPAAHATQLPSLIIARRNPNRSRKCRRHRRLRRRWSNSLQLLRKSAIAMGSLRSTHRIRRCRRFCAPCSRRREPRWICRREQVVNVWQCNWDQDSHTTCWPPC